MARLAGRAGRLYVGIASAGVPEPIAFLSKWSLKATTNKIKVTAFGDVNEVYLAGLSDAQGDFAGFYDDATAQVYTAATDGVARKFYLYPNTTTNTQYWYGTMIPDFSVDATVDGPINITGTWAAASVVTKIG